MNATNRAGLMKWSGLRALLAGGLLAAAGLVTAARVDQAAAEPAAAKAEAGVIPGLRVHEWGTFTVVPDHNGNPLNWYALPGPVELPPFVFTRRAGFGYLSKGNMAAAVRMETPVIYVHTERELKLDVGVKFPGGVITEWYPDRTSEEAGEFRWARVRALPGATLKFPESDGNNHYFRARGTGAAPLQISHGCGSSEAEEFLFYRGLRFQPFASLHAMAGADGITLAPDGAGAPQQVMVFQRTGDRIRMSVAHLGTGFTRVPLESLPEATLADVQSRLGDWLTESGLTEAEAKAMLATWEKDWFEPGTRLFHLLPRPLVDELLPLTVEPRPESVVRTFVVRTDLLLPAERLEARQIVMANPDTKQVKEQLQKRFGRFGMAAAQMVLAETDSAEVRTAAGKAISAFWPRPVVPQPATPPQAAPAPAAEAPAANPPANLQLGWSTPTVHP